MSKSNKEGDTKKQTFSPFEGVVFLEAVVVFLDPVAGRLLVLDAVVLLAVTFGLTSLGGMVKRYVCGGGRERERERGYRRR